MKKLCLITLLMCFIATCTACGNKESQIASTEKNAEENASEEESKEAQDTEKVQEDSSSESNEDAQEDTQNEAKAPVEAVEKPQVLSLQETRNAKYEGINDFEKFLMISKFNYVSFWEGKEAYPQMERTLSEMAGMITRTQEDEADNIISFAEEMFDIAGGNFETQISTSDVQIRRADSVAVSYLTDSYANYGFIEDFRGMWGSNYDTQTGEELLLNDVIKDMTEVPVLVTKELNSHLWAGEGYEETVIEDYFRNTPVDGISWTLDYNGVTFYFGDGDITEPGNGGQTATISFAEYPELFEEKYMNVPDAYMVRLPLDLSFFPDLDGDGTLEELNVSGVYNADGRFYSQFGIYTDTDGYYHYEDFYAYGYNPYYVKTADGKHYLYMFCEENDADNRQMILVVFDVSDGQFVRVGEMNAAPAYIPSDDFILPLNPDNLLLDNFDSMEQDFGTYMVGKDGMPVRK
ncbi:MAG: hypothetical protein E7299_00520 [Lachnospiraceae bacterium]|nr:hypothetical protein [Lachnospiraceae bacterium]